MKDLFSHLLQRSRGENLPSPVVPSRFEIGPAPADTWGEVEQFVTARREQRPPAAPLDSRRQDRLQTRQAGGDDPAPVMHRPDEADDVGPASRGSAAERASASPPPMAPPMAPIDLQAIIAAALRHRDETRGTDAAHADRPLPDRVVTADDEPAPTRLEGRPIVMAALPPQPLPVAVEPDRPAAPAIVEVRIGRIEISAAPPPIPRPAPVARPARPATVGLSLREYLARRQRR